MNNTRRKKLDVLRSRIEEIHDLLEELETEERDAFESLPEGLQLSERGEAMENAADLLEAAADNLTEAMENIEEAAG